MIAFSTLSLFVFYHAFCVKKLHTVKTDKYKCSKRDLL